MGRAIDLNSDNDGTVTLTDIFNPEYNRGPADYDVAPHLQLQLDLRAAVGGAARLRRLAVQQHPYPRCGLPIQITQSQSMLSTGITNNRPNTICDPVLNDWTIDKFFNTACFQQVSDTTGTFGNTGRNTVRGPGAGTSTCRSSRTPSSGT